MKRFHCENCASIVHFDNLVCLGCGYALGFDAGALEMRSFSGLPPERTVVCANAEACGCNWLAPAGDGPCFCFACGLNRMVPDLSNPSHVERWTKLEAAKRHFLYGIKALGLPIVTRAEDPEEGLGFELLADTPDVGHVMTGHENGLITINIDEASAPDREAARIAMGEALRTLIGHFRHESGHYYWNRLVRYSGKLDAARAVFGNETIDYAAALDAHYADGPPPDWQQNFISAYASSHPWEDFAESWAHYLHIADGLETAFAYHLLPASSDWRYEPGKDMPLDRMIAAWVELSIGINAVNRSLGQPDLYPFVFSDRVIEKLEFVHRLIMPKA
jgi:hypothetical protein